MLLVDALEFQKKRTAELGENSGDIVDMEEAEDDDSNIKISDMSGDSLARNQATFEPDSGRDSAVPPESQDNDFTMVVD